MTAVSRSEVASKLKITNPQTKQIKKIMESMNKEIAAAMPAPPQGFGGPPGGFPGGMDGQPGGFGGPPGAGTGGGDEKGAPTAKKKKGANARPSRMATTPTTRTDPVVPADPVDQEVPAGRAGPDSRRCGRRWSRAFRPCARPASRPRKQIEGLLTDDQKAAWTKLIGEPFDLSTLQQGPGRPGGPPEKGQMKKKAQKDDGDGQ